MQKRKVDVAAALLFDRVKKTLAQLLEDVAVLEKHLGQRGVLAKHPTAEEHAESPPRNRSTSGMCCSFCGKGQREVPKLIAGPVVYICAECIILCVEILHEEATEAAKKEQAAQ